MNIGFIFAIIKVIFVKKRGGVSGCPGLQFPFDPVSCLNFALMRGGLFVDATVAKVLETGSLAKGIYFLFQEISAQIKDFFSLCLHSSF